MQLIYTNKAKDDLAKIDWRKRDLIISNLRELPGKSTIQKKFIRPIEDTALIKVNIDEYVIIGKIEGTDLNVITVVKKPKIRVPE